MATPKLIVTSEQLRGTTFELTKDELTAGRSDERDICLKDPTVSTLHCKFTKTEKGVMLEDVGSTNGTRVNGAKISAPVLLNTGDTVQIGAFELLYDSEDKTMRMSIHQTQTGININAANTTQTIKAMELSGFTVRKQSSGLTNKLILALVIVLILIFLVLLGFFFLSIQQGPQAGASIQSTLPAMSEIA